MLVGSLGFAKFPQNMAVHKQATLNDPTCAPPTPYLLSNWQDEGKYMLPLRHRKPGKCNILELLLKLHYRPA